MIVAGPWRRSLILRQKRPLKDTCRDTAARPGRIGVMLTGLVPNVGILGSVCVFCRDPIVLETQSTDLVGAISIQRY